jgi:hypothetical protein
MTLYVYLVLLIVVFKLALLIWSVKMIYELSQWQNEKRTE